MYLGWFGKVSTQALPANGNICLNCFPMVYTGFTPIASSCRPNPQMPLGLFPSPPPLLSVSSHSTNSASTCPSTSAKSKIRKSAFANFRFETPHLRNAECDTTAMTFSGLPRNHFRTSKPRFVNASMVYEYSPVLAGNTGSTVDQSNCGHSSFIVGRALPISHGASEFSCKSARSWTGTPFSINHPKLCVAVWRVRRSGLTTISSTCDASGTLFLRKLDSSSHSGPKP